MKRIIRTLEAAINEIEIVSDALDSHMRDEYADDLKGVIERLRAVHRMITNGGRDEEGTLIPA